MWKKKDIIFSSLLFFPSPNPSSTYNSIPFLSSLLFLYFSPPEIPLILIVMWSPSLFHFICICFRTKLLHPHSNFSPTDSSLQNMVRYSKADLFSEIHIGGVSVRFVPGIDKGYMKSLNLNGFHKVKSMIVSIVRYHQFLLISFSLPISQYLGI